MMLSRLLSPRLQRRQVQVGLACLGLAAGLAGAQTLLATDAAIQGDADPSWRFVARFHAVFLHLPIGFIVLAFLLEIGSLFRRNAEREKLKSFILGLNFLAAVVVVIMGLLLASEGGFDTSTLERHMWLGVAFTGLSLVTAVTHWLARHSPDDGALRWRYRGVLVATVVVMMAAGHYGGNLTHGSRYLVEYAPRILKDLAKLEEGDSTAAPETRAATEASLYATSIEPVLRAKCLSCHGAEKQKGDYRLDEPTQALAGGESGKRAIVPGAPLESYLLELVLLPPGHSDAMPPKGKEPLTAEEILTLARWIQSGASFGVESPPPAAEIPVAVAPAEAVPLPATATVAKVAAIVPGAASLAGNGEEAKRPDSGPVDFVEHVKPVLEKRCVSCHGPKKKKGRLDLHSWDLVLKGGKEAGAAVVPGKADKSPLYVRIVKSKEGIGSDELMPPADEGGPLLSSEIEAIKRWIDEGAQWPLGLELSVAEGEGA